MRYALSSILVLVLLATSRAADSRVPAELQDIDVDEHLNAQLPLDTVFTNERGQQLTLRDCLIPGKPAILQLGYFGCPMLCDLVSKGMLESLQNLDLQMGRDFSAINLSFDGRETTNDAYLKKKGFMEHYTRGGAGAAWHFLTGQATAVKAITDAVGFKYKWIEAQQQFSHPAVLMILTPDGRISRYLYGVQFPQQTLRLSLVEASDGKIGTTTDHALLLCFQYNESTGKYTFAAVGLMRVAGVVTALVLGGVLVRQFIKERRARLT